jgi:MarR family transcriptional regulator, repressor for mepA
MRAKPGIIDELGELALSTRLMRLSEWTRKDVTKIYKEYGIAFESKWFPVLYILRRKTPLSVVGLAEELGYSHPSVIALVREMEQHKLVRSVTSKTDGRKRMLELTPKALEWEKKMQPLWDRMRIVAGEIYNNGSSLLRAIADTEAALRDCSYYDRFKKLK